MPYSLAKDGEIEENNRFTDNRTTRNLKVIRMEKPKPTSVEILMRRTGVNQR